MMVNYSKMVRGLSKRMAALPIISKNSKAVLERRYLLKDDEGNPIEQPEDLFDRVAYNIAEGDRQYGAQPQDIIDLGVRFYDMMIENRFMPNSPTLMNAGRELQQLSACFVLDVPDSIDGIFQAARQTAVIHKSGGGTGFSFSKLRPSNDIVGSTGGIASGPVSFIRIFDTATDVVKQGGTRRGANMGILSVSHPDIEMFIHSKDDDQSLQNFNISVAVDEKFMKAVEANLFYSLINPKTGEKVREIDARQLFNDMVESAWKTGDPGIIFIDRMNEPRSNPVPSRGPIMATNPCGEQPLYAYDSCNLGSINLAKFVVEGEDGPDISWDSLEATIYDAVHFLDNVVTMNKYPIPEIEETSTSIRRIGLGVMGWADMLIQLGIPYNSDGALFLANKLMKTINILAQMASEELAEIRGSFPDWAKSEYGPNGKLGMASSGIRNSTRTTIAPTGTISIIANCSSGIEPLFAVSYVRHVMDDSRLVEVNPYFESIAKEEGFYSSELMERVAEQGSLHGIDEIPVWVQELFVTSHEIAPEWHVKMQAEFQKHTDNAVSKTVNFANDATIEDVRKVYMLAYEEGCKGVTIYRDGSKSKQVLNIGGKNEVVDVWERPSVVTGSTTRIQTGHGKLYVTVNKDEENRPIEVFSTLGKAGGCDTAQLEAMSRLISLALRSGVESEHIVQQLTNITCCPVWHEGRQVTSTPDAVASVLGTGIHKITVGNKVACRECGGGVVMQEGCSTCLQCGWSACA